jgi:hypothetical protein
VSYTYVTPSGENVTVKASLGDEFTYGDQAGAAERLAVHKIGEHQTIWCDKVNNSSCQ